MMDGVVEAVDVGGRIPGGVLIIIPGVVNEWAPDLAASDAGASDGAWDEAFVGGISTLAGSMGTTVCVRAASEAAALSASVTAMNDWTAWVGSG